MTPTIYSGNIVREFRSEKTIQHHSASVYVLAGNEADAKERILNEYLQDQYSWTGIRNDRNFPHDFVHVPYVKTVERPDLQKHLAGLLISRTSSKCQFFLGPDIADKISSEDLVRFTNLLTRRKTILERVVADLHINHGMPIPQGFMETH